MFFGLEKRRIFAYGQAIDMRKSFDGLISLTKRELQEDPLSGCLFVFFNRRGGGRGGEEDIPRLALIKKL